MQRVVSFYEKLPRGAAPEVKPKGLLGRYQARHFGKNPSGTRMHLSCTRNKFEKVLIRTQLSFTPLPFWSPLVMPKTTTSISVSAPELYMETC